MVKHQKVSKYYENDCRLDEMVKKWGREGLTFYAIIPALNPFW